ncbi:MAG TPA: hypothetical protein VG897_11360, partial [Terriglobales bacterium]|nr:hypothetical protein [Terriglobales bacterium]
MDSYILGLDLGSASIGWAVVEPNKRVVDSGVRIFDPGVNLEDFARGAEGSSNNVVRRTARLHRRQLRRHAARQRDLFRLLQEHNLLPSGSNDSAGRHKHLEQLDTCLRERWRTRLQENGIPEQSLVYFLRKCALDEPLKADEFGRILYHLGQRRGFKSNRRDEAKLAEANESKKEKKTEKQKDDLGKVKAGIQQLSEAIAHSGTRTLGEYFATLSVADQRVRSRWTDRKMFIHEFEAIWNAQVVHHQLHPGLRSSIYDLLFFQRPIARNDHLIGMCELEPTERRAPMGSLAAQHFRLLQKVNDLEYGDDVKTQRLTPEQRTLLLQKLDDEGDLKFEAIRQLFGLGKGVRFNLERGGEKKLPGNRTNAAMMRAIPDLWKQVPLAEKNSIVSACLDVNDNEELASVLMKNCGLAADDAIAVCGVHLEDGYHRLSLKAMRRLLELMESGIHFKTAEDQIYGTSFSGGKIYELLPPLEDVLPQV